MPRDPQGAGTRTEWRNVYADGSKGAWFTQRWVLDLQKPIGKRVAVEERIITETITRHPIPPHAGEETKG